MKWPGLQRIPLAKGGWVGEVGGGEEDGRTGFCGNCVVVVVVVVFFFVSAVYVQRLGWDVKRLCAVVLIAAVLLSRPHIHVISVRPSKRSKGMLKGIRFSNRLE